MDKLAFIKSFAIFTKGKRYKKGDQDRFVVLDLNN